MSEEAKAAGNGEVKRAPATFRAILGEKLGMTQTYHRNVLFGVSVIKAGPCPVLRVKSKDGKDGYDAVQLAFGARKDKNVGKAQLAQFKAAGVSAAKHVREIRAEEGTETKGVEAGQQVLVDVIFKLGDYVDVRATSKGKGFAGAMKRHNFRGMPASHGASDKERSPGSLASRRSLGRVLPGQRMAGRMGGETVCMQKLEVIKIDAEKNLLYVNGSVPGPQGGLVTVQLTSKPKKHYVEPTKLAVRKDKMGNIIKTPAPKGGAKK
jgi:large subunit ribosomal protein L3